jgi:PleD family two-component response regulator
MRAICAARSLCVTVSIGLAFQHLGETGHSLISRAGQAFYASKTHGSNLVTLAAA